MEPEMNLELNGKRALVTGSSSGLGEAIARTLAKEGAWVVVQGRRAGEAQRVKEAIEAAGGRSAVAVGDLGNEATADRVSVAALAAFGGIDILVNNAGAFPPGDWRTENAAGLWNGLFTRTSPRWCG
jgi:NAD(P)-dependent dehydrogenase (short-subunit alcohol dehydrogenase family)